MAMLFETKRKIKVLLAKSRLDAHDRGIVYVAAVLRDHGIEVLPIRYGVADEVVETAMQEDVDVIGLSFYGTGVMHDTSTVLSSLRDRGLDDKVVIIGGTIPEKQRSQLLQMGVKGIFGPSDPVRGVVDCINSSVTTK